MATAQAVWGIDVGRCALKAVRLRAGAEGKIELLASDYIEHAKILSQPDADRHELIAAALEKFLSHNDISKDRVVVSVPGQHTLARFTKLPPVAPKRIPDIVRYEADQQIPFDMDEVIWDYQTFQQEGLPDIEVGIFAMKRELLREHLLHFEQVSVEPAAVQSVPLAVYNAAQFDGLLVKDTTVLLDIGAENTDLIIGTPNSLWTRTIPLGGNHFTEALVKAFKLSFAKAESLKRTAETSKYRRQIFQAMRPVFADLVQELQRSIGFYSSTHRDAEIERVIGVGNAFKLPGLQKYLEQNLGMDVQTPSSFKKVVTSEASQAEALKSEFPSFFVAYGLALQGLDLTKVTSNLLPTELAKQAVWRKKRPAFAAAAACLVAAGAVVWFRQTSDMRALAAGVEEVGRVSVTRLEQAAEIIDLGPPPGMSDLAKAASVQAAGKLLRSEADKLRNQGMPEREQAENLVQLQKYKTIIPAVMQVVHQSLPDPGIAVDQRDDIEGYVRALKAVPRSERRQVWIDLLDMQYEPNLHELEWPSVVSTPPPLNAMDQPLEGIWLKINCVTPNQGAARFINETFMETLRKNGRRPGAGFYFDRIAMFTGGKLDLRGGPGRPGGFPGGAASSAASPEHLDPLTDEPRDNDYQFEIFVDVVPHDIPDELLEEDAAEEEGETEKNEKGTGG